MAAAIGAIFKEAALATGVGVASLTMAAGKSLEVAGKTSAKAVEVTGVVADKSLNITKKGVEVGSNITIAGLNTAGIVGKAGLQTASVATEAAAQITQAAAKSTANVGQTALATTAQVTTDTLKVSADAASAAAKFSVGTVTTALKGLDNLRDLGGMTGQAWVERVRVKKQENSKLASMRTPQIVLGILVQDFEKVAKDLRSSFKVSISASDNSLKVLIVIIKDLYCMSWFRRRMKNTCPSNSQLRTTLEKKVSGQAKELDGRSVSFFKSFDENLAKTLAFFKAESLKPVPEMKSEEEQINKIKALFIKKLDEFSSVVATALSSLTKHFETRSLQYQKIIDRAYEGNFAINGVFNQPVAAPAAGGKRKTRKQMKRSKKTRKH
jgi:hypothetical protein